jgi:hypothetical protein
MRDGAVRLAVAATFLLAFGCAADRAALPAGSALEPLPVLPLRAPDEFDRATRSLASSVLLDDAASAEAARDRIEALDADRLSGREPPSGLAPYAADAVNATERDALRFRVAQEALLDRGDTPEPLRRRIETELRDDPLTLADARIADAQRTRLGRLVNAMTRALGTSLSNPVLLPYRLVTGLMNLGLRMRVEDELLPAERQALGHWKAFVEQNPASPQAAALLDEIEEAQRRWIETQRARSVRRGRRALELDQPDTARLLAERALRYAPEDPDAAAVRDEAQREIERRHAERARSLTARPTADPRQERVLALALLLPGGNVAGKARGLETAVGGGPLADEARFARALALADAGEERESWRALERLADAGPARSNMSRHAAALYQSSKENPARAFRAARRTALRRHFQALFLGPLAAGPPDHDLPRPVEWLVAIPRLPAVVIGLPMRIITFPFQRPDRKEPAVFARRYLERFPAGQEAGSMRDWLIETERDRGNAVAALRLAQSAPDADPEALTELRDEASQQALAMAKAERRYEARIGLLLEVARRFPESEAAHEAGLLVREEAGRSSAQRIRIARSFLLENPVVAGPKGFALKPALLDGERENGELHAEGMTLLGGDAVEFAYLGPGLGSDDPPERRRERISPERIARGVAQLEESTAQLLRTDPDLQFEPDAGRDLYFERARLGVAGTEDPRPEARSSYSYIGTRERFGVVRGRESILPVEIVLQGSFEDFGLGAFPRIRLPKPTPDQILYR